MKKWLWIFVFLGVLFWTWVFLRLTHRLEYYTISTVANAPALPKGTIAFASNLKAPVCNSFICFKAPDQDYTWISRIIGRAGDVIEIEGARVYRNGKLLDEPFACYTYEIHKSQVNRIDAYIRRNKKELTPLGDTTYTISLSGSELKACHLSLIPNTSPKGVTNDEIFDDFKNKGYNQDNLGPVTVPPNSYFVLGDNRPMAMDSRYIGFIKADRVVSTVLGH